MEDYRLGEVERRFADLIWANAPLPSGELVRLCQGELGWKKSTTYTVLKRLCRKGLFVNDNGTVRALLSREEFAAGQSAAFVADAFDGSLPKFLAAFYARQRLTEEEVAALQALIDAQRGE